MKIEVFFTFIAFLIINKLLQKFVSWNLECCFIQLDHHPRLCKHFWLKVFNFQSHWKTVIYHSVIHEPLRSVQVVSSGSDPESSSVNVDQNRKSFVRRKLLSFRTGIWDVDVEDKTVLLSDHSFGSDMLELKQNDNNKRLFLHSSV